MISELEELLRNEELRELVDIEKIEQLPEEDQKTIADLLFIYSKRSPEKVKVEKEIKRDAANLTAFTGFSLATIHELLHAIGAYLTGAKAKFDIANGELRVPVYGDYFQNFVAGILPHIVMSPLGFYTYRKSKNPLIKAYGLSMPTLTGLEVFTKTDMCYLSKILAHQMGLEGEPTYFTIKMSLIIGILGASYFGTKKLN